MKRISRQVLTCVAMLICTSVFSNQQQATTITLKQAKHYRVKSGDKVYIQAKQFASLSTANHYKSNVQSKMKYPVHVMHTHGHYYVTVGPLVSTADINKAVSKLPKVTANTTPAPKATSKKTVTVVAKHDQKKKTVNQHPVTQTKQMTNKLDRLWPVNPKQHAALTQPVKVYAQAGQTEFISQDEQTSQVKQVKQVKQSSSAKKTKPVHQAQQEDTTDFDPVMKPVKSGWFEDYTQRNWIVTGGFGLAYPSFGSSMGVYNNSGSPAPYNQDVYSTKSRTQPLLAALVGYRLATTQQWWFPALSVNLSYQHLFARNIGGSVKQYSDPAFTNYDYNWQVSSDVFMALLKVNMFDYKGVSPYLLGGMGSALNRASNYSETPLAGVTPRTNPAFESNATIGYAYRIGGGVEYQVNPQVLVSAEYQFQSIGTVTSGHGAGTWSTQSLNLGSYHSNAVLLNMTYLFGETK